MSVSVVVDTSQLDRLNARLRELAHMDLHPLIDSMASVVISQTQRRISDEKSAPDGTPWAEWSDTHARTRRGGQSLLQGEGDLLESIGAFFAFDAKGGEAEVGSNLVYAAHHQFGGEETGSGITARPFLGISDANEDDLSALLDNFLDSVGQELSR